MVEDAPGRQLTVEHLRRAVILRAVVDVVAERGFAGATVTLVVRRAKVSTRTFYELFGGLDDCLIAVMDETLEQVTALASRALEEAEVWQDGLVSAFAAVLTFFDSEPALARVCMVETLAGGPAVLRHREGVVAAFRVLIVERIEREVPTIPRLIAEGALSSVMGVLHAHMVEQKPGPLIELIGPLMGMAIAPYLGVRGVEQAIKEGDELARAILSGDSRWSRLAQLTQGDTLPTEAPGATLSANLGNVSARRARECVSFLAAHPGSSNREVAAGIGLVHQSQISKLLVHIAQVGLASKHSEGKGKRNAWRLTPHGEEIARAIAAADL
jgi:AcrR family transcriptional regulator